MNTAHLAVIRTAATIADFLARAKRLPAMQEPVSDVRWALKPPVVPLFRDELTFFVCQLTGRRRIDNAALIAVKYRPSRKAQEQWMWRDAGREAVIASYAAGLSHPNCLNYQWGVTETLVKEMGLL